MKMYPWNFGSCVGGPTHITRLEVVFGAFNFRPARTNRCVIQSCSYVRSTAGHTADECCLVGPWGGDALVLAVARRFEAALAITGTDRQLPTVAA